MNVVVRTCAEANYVNGSCSDTGTLWTSPFFIVGVVVLVVAVTLIALVKAIRTSGRPPWR